MEILITDAFSAVELVENSPDTYRVISISSPYPLIPSEYQPSIPSITRGAREILYLQFHDATEELVVFAPQLFRLATEEDCCKALEFLSKGGNCLVHCAAGVSRSPGIVLGHLLHTMKEYERAVDTLLAIRPCADPNAHVIKLMCRILQREDEYPLILQYFDQKKYGFSRRDRRKGPSLNPYCDPPDSQ